MLLWPDGFALLPPYATTGIPTHLSRVAPNQWDLLKDAQPTELPRRGNDTQDFLFRDSFLADGVTKPDLEALPDGHHGLVRNFVRDSRLPLPGNDRRKTSGNDGRCDPDRTVFGPELVRLPEEADATERHEGPRSRNQDRSRQRPENLRKLMIVDPLG